MKNVAKSTTICRQKSTATKKPDSIGKFHSIWARFLLLHAGYVICCSKRQKIDVHRWSLSSSTLLLDELFDSGVKVLDIGSESSDESEQKGCNEVCDFIDTSCSALTPASKEMRVRKNFCEVVSI